MVAAAAGQGGKLAEFMAYPPEPEPQSLKQQTLIAKSIANQHKDPD